MRKHGIVISTVFVLLALGMPTPQFAQDASNQQKALDEEHATLLGLVRTIIGAEVSDSAQYGSFSSWQTLVAHQSDYLSKWLAQFYWQKNAHFAETPEILPAWNLRLTVQPDGKGFVLVLEDANDKTGFAALSDERGIIRECKYLQ